jgi:hypothetical protein
MFDRPALQSPSGYSAAFTSTLGVTCAFAPLSMIFPDGTARGMGNHAEGSGETPSRHRAVPLSKLPLGSSCLSHSNRELRHRLNERSPAVTDSAGPRSLSTSIARLAVP